MRVAATAGVHYTCTTPGGLLRALLLLLDKYKLSSRIPPGALALCVEFNPAAALLLLLML